jgi:CHASE1-domain containing sensor protein
MLAGGLGDAQEQLTAIASALDTWPGMTRAEYRAFVSRALALHREIQALEWIPHVPHARRVAVEEAARADSLPDFEFRELVPGGPHRTADPRADYYPVLFVEPLARNRPAVGLDLGASLPRRAAIEKARDTARPVASAPVRLAQENGDRMGFLLFQPVYTGSPTSVEERRLAFRGCAVAVFRTEDLVNRVLGELSQGEIALDIFDDETGPAIYQSSRRPPGLGELRLVRHLEVAGRRWRLEFAATAEGPEGAGAPRIVDRTE